MQRNDLLTLLDREAETLAGENNHSAAALMRAAAEEIRRSAAPDYIHCEKPPTPEDIERIQKVFKDKALRFA